MKLQRCVPPMLFTFSVLLSHSPAQAGGFNRIKKSVLSKIEGREAKGGLSPEDKENITAEYKAKLAGLYLQFKDRYFTVNVREFNRAIREFKAGFSVRRNKALKTNEGSDTKEAFHREAEAFLEDHDYADIAAFHAQLMPLVDGIKKTYSEAGIRTTEGVLESSKLHVNEGAADKMIRKTATAIKLVEELRMEAGLNGPNDKTVDGKLRDLKNKASIGFSGLMKKVKSSK